MSRWYCAIVAVVLVLAVLFIFTVIQDTRVRQRRISQEEHALARLREVYDLHYDRYSGSDPTSASRRWAARFSDGAEDVGRLTLTSSRPVVIEDELVLLQAFDTPLALSIVPPLTVSNDALLLLRQANILGLGLNEQPVDGRGLQHVGAISSLRYLFLADTLVTNDSLRHLAPLPRLRVLFLDGTTISDDGTKHLQRLHTLETLGLSRTGITDKGVCGLAHLDALTYLAIADTAITDQSLDCIIRHHPRLNTLIVDGTGVTKHGVGRVIKHMTTLDYLSIKGTAVAPADARRLLRMATHITTMHADWD